MYDDGVKIKEILDELNMNLKDIYKYLRWKIGGWSNFFFLLLYY